MSMWKCGECGCQNIAYGLQACPQCDAPKAEPAPAARPAAKAKGGD